MTVSITNEPHAEQPHLGPDGYLVCARRWPNGVDGDERWSREHLVTYHGWPAPMVDNAPSPTTLDNLHSEQHAKATTRAHPIPHVHHDFVPAAIEASCYSRKLKDALLAVIDLAAVDERFAE